MSKGGSQTSSTSIDPDIKKAFLANFEQAKNVAGALPVQEFAGFNPMYQAGERQLINTGLAGPGLANIDRAAEMTAAGAQYQPGMVGGFGAGPASLASAQGYGATDVNAAQANMGDISRYMNPYTSGVIDTSLADIERARAAASSRIGQQAAAAKAFGGSRQALAQGASSGQFAEQAARTAAQLRAQGFDVAANQMQQDLARQQQAAIQNAAQRTAASQFGAGAMNQAALANAAARNQAAQFNANIGQQAALANQQAGLQGAQLRLGGANQLGNQAAQQQALRMTGAQAVMGAGGARQAQDQQRMDAIRNIGLQRLGIVQSSLGANPANLGMISQTPYTQNTGAGLLGGALAGSQLAGLTGGALSAGAGAGLGALLALI
jgi:hypothetical protein